jgi:AbrB family looped-hinge helix DNA binding protein
LATTTYHAGKLYLPKRIREELGLSDGDRVEVTSRDGKIIASPLRAEEPDALLVRLLREPLERTKTNATPVSPPWRRRDIYGDQRR